MAEDGRKKKIDRIYERLEKALLEESCTFSEANRAVERIRNTYFIKKGNNFLNDASMQEVANAESHYEKARS